LLVHIGDPSSNQATTLESQIILMIQELFGQTLTPATATTEAVRVPAAIVAAGPAEDGAESVSAAPQETSGRADITTSAIVPAAETAPGREGRPLGHTPKHAPKFASAYTDRSIFLSLAQIHAHLC